MSHTHGPVEATVGTSDGRLWATAALNVGITAAEFVGAFFAGSLSLLSDAIHNLSDVFAVVLALWARRVGERPATVRHTYGFKRAEVLAALANAAILIAITVLIAREAIVRLLDPTPVGRDIMLWAGAFAFVANVASVLLLRTHGEDDVNVRSAFLHMLQDALGSLAVICAALAAHTPVGPYVDSVAALLIGILVFRGAWSIVRETLSVLLEGAPEGVRADELVNAVNDRFAPASMHHLHVWEITPGRRALTAHVNLGQSMDGMAIDALFSEIRTFLRNNWRIEHSTLEPETAECGDTSLLGQWQTAHDHDA